MPPHVLMCRLTGQKLLVETPIIYASKDMQAYIQQELNRPCKRWVVDVINGSREASEVRLRTSEFVLLPDTERVNRYGRGQTLQTDSGAGAQKPATVFRPTHTQRQDQFTMSRTRLLWGGRGQRQPTRCKSPIQSPPSQARWCTGWANPHWLAQESQPSSESQTPEQEQVQQPVGEQVNWLSIATEPGLHSLRDLRGKHLPMLKRMLRLSKAKIHAETGVSPEEIMAYVHYPPSVYQLHVHFAYPYAQYNHRDVFRIHSLSSVINNLEIDPDYYQKARLQVSLGRNSVLHQICSSAPPDWSSTESLTRRKSI